MLNGFAARPQEQPQLPVFEVASVKPASGGPLKVQSDPGPPNHRQRSVLGSHRDRLRAAGIPIPGSRMAAHDPLRHCCHHAFAPAPRRRTRHVAIPTRRPLQAQGPPRAENHAGVLARGREKWSQAQATGPEPAPSLRPLLQPQHGANLRLLCAIDGFPGCETSPTVFDALQSQMGLKLDAHTDKVEVTVVDHVEKPSGN